jgi:hypothetical protein
MTLLLKEFSTIIKKGFQRGPEYNKGNHPLMMVKSTPYQGLNSRG